MDTYNLIIQQYTGIDHMISAGITMYPNPSSGLFYISFPETNSYQLTITTIHGHTVYNRKVEQQNETINLQSLENGVYLLTVIGENEKIHVKLVINK